MKDIKLSIIFSEIAYLGTHTEPLTTALEYIHGETVEDLWARCVGDGKGFRDDRKVVLRLCHKEVDRLA